MGVLETVKIVSKKTESGYMIINKSDFTNKDKIFKEENVAKVAKVAKVVEKEKIVIADPKRRKD